ncbi:MAG: glutathione S-transferase N-terminal domain-containing protein [Magnetospirillum sp.]|nr:glutathione S-transferase N-terminal domain-containing protein [Magnetospirillum sp.]
MKLRFSATSPYVRKVRMTAIECGIELGLVPTNPWAPDTDLVKDNPLSKVPALVLDNDETLFDSPVICEYLDTLHNGHKLFPHESHERFRQLKVMALADGILDAAIQARVEATMRPEDKRWNDWIERQQAAISRALDLLEKDVGHWGGVFLIGPISVVAALSYLDFRKVCDWRNNRPHLAHWYTTTHNRRSVRETEPAE